MWTNLNRIDIETAEDPAPPRAHSARSGVVEVVFEDHPDASHRAHRVRGSCSATTSSQVAALSEPLDWSSEYVEPEWRIGT